MVTFRQPMALPENFEPAVRDPKKLLRTALILVGVMIVGGWFVMRAYTKWASERVADDRPAIIHRIQPERSLRVVRQDGEIADLMDLRGKVFAIHVIDLDQLERSQLSLDALKKISLEYAEEDKFRVVTLILNPGPASGLVKKLEGAATTLQVEMPQRWVASTQSETLTKFIRKELKPSSPPVEIDNWEFDSSVVLVDRNGHLRQAVIPMKDKKTGQVVSSQKVPFDFDQAKTWDESGKGTGTELTNVETLEQLMSETIAKLIVEEHVEKKSGILPVILGGLFLLMLLVIVIKIIRSRTSSPA